MSEDKGKLDMRSAGSHVKEIHLNGEREGDAAPFVFDPRKNALRFDYYDDAVAIVNGGKCTKEERAAGKRIGDLDYYIHALISECARQTTPKRRKILEECVLEVMRMVQEHGIYHIPVFVDPIEPDAETESLYLRGYRYNYSPCMYTPAFTGEVSDEAAAGLFADAMLDFGCSKRMLWQAVVYTDGKPVPYANAVRETAGIFEKYAKFLKEDFARNRDSREYQHRFDRNPEWIRD